MASADGDVSLELFLFSDKGGSERLVEYLRQSDVIGASPFPTPNSKIAVHKKDAYSKLSGVGLHGKVVGDEFNFGGLVGGGGMFMDLGFHLANDSKGTYLTVGCDKLMLDALYTYTQNALLNTRQHSARAALTGSLDGYYLTFSLNLFPWDNFNPDNSYRNSDDARGTLILTSTFDEDKIVNYFLK